MELTQGEFGGRVGIWRLMELFHEHAACHVRQVGVTDGTNQVSSIYTVANRETLSGSQLT